MAEKNFNTRIVHKHDIEANWQLAVNFTPKQGELIVYDPDGNFSYPRIKIGDGEKNVNALPFITDNVEIGEGGEIIYKQTEEPNNAPVGSLWVDLDEYAGGQLFKQPEEPSTATEGDLWVDTDEEDGGLPGLTDEDNGKILLAQNGQWEVSNNSWNDLNNKPVIYGNTLEWDGNTTGLESIWHKNSFYLYKVSNLVISEEELLNNSSMFVGFDSIGGMHSFYPTQSNKTDLGIDMITVLFTDNGIYFGKGIHNTIPDVYITSLTFPGRQDLPRRKLDEGMLPAYVRNLKEKEKTYFDKISTGGNSLDWDGNIEGLSVDPTWDSLYKISDIAPSFEDWQKGGTITFNNQGKVEKTISFPIHENDIVERERVDGLPGCLIDLSIHTIISTIEEGDHSYEPGLYVIKNSDFYISNITLNDYAKFPKKVFKKEVLPPITWKDIGEGYVDNLAAKYLPNEAPTITETYYLSPSSPILLNYIKTSDDILTYENFANGFEITANMFGQVSTKAYDISKIIETEDYITDGDNVSGLASFRIYKENNSVGAEPGTYLLNSVSGSSPVAIVMNLMVPQSFWGVKPLDVSYLPKNFILPEVTSENEGQILRVVNGVWTLVDFPTS